MVVRKPTYALLKHYPLWNLLKHLHSLCIIDSTFCRRCADDEETAKHFLCQCPTLFLSVMIDHKLWCFDTTQNIILEWKVRDVLKFAYYGVYTMCPERPKVNQPRQIYFDTVWIVSPVSKMYMAYMTKLRTSKSTIFKILVMLLPRYNAIFYVYTRIGIPYPRHTLRPIH